MTKLIGIADVAKRLDRPVATIRDWRYRGYGPKSAKIGGQVVYREADVEAWIDAQFNDEAAGA